MEEKRNKDLIQNPVFIIGILMLFVNDQILKFQFPSFLTGKLSDVLGIVTFPLLLTFIFPKLKENSVFFAYIIFAFWKSEYSQPLIDFYNQYTFIQTSRIIDYSDLLVFIFLPIPYYLIKNNSLNSFKAEWINSNLILMGSLFILIAESPPINYYYSKNNGNLQFSHCNMTVHCSQPELIEKLGFNGVKFDTIRVMKVRNLADSTTTVKKYIINQMVLEKDTLRDLDFTMITRKKRTEIIFNGMNVPQDLNDEELKGKLKKYYKKLVINELKDKLR